jgi:hypothetical protein
MQLSQLIYGVRAEIQVDHSTPAGIPGVASFLQEISTVFSIWLHSQTWPFFPTILFFKDN